MDGCGAGRCRQKVANLKTQGIVGRSLGGWLGPQQLGCYAMAGHSVSYVLINYQPHLAACGKRSAATVLDGYFAAPCHAGTKHIPV